MRDREYIELIREDGKLSIDNNNEDQFFFGKDSQYIKIQQNYNIAT